MYQYMSKSIISNDKVCYVCGETRLLHKHHIFFGTANREQSEKYGCWVWLCYAHHNGSNAGVHFNKKLDDRLKRTAQEKFIEKYKDKDFRTIFGKNYL